MRDGAVYCRAHYELILQSEAEMEAVGVSSGMAFPPLSPATPRLAFYNGVGAAQKGRPRKRKLPNEEIPPLTPLTPGMGKYRTKKGWAWMEVDLDSGG